MKSLETLDSNYIEVDKIDLKNNKNQALIVNGLSLSLLIILTIIGHFIVPIKQVLSYSLPQIFLMLVFILLYITLHEAVHGISMKILKCKKINFGFNIVYAYAGSKSYFDKSGYIFVALAPIIFFFIAFTIALLFVPMKWFWIIYFLQVTNISCSSGDLFVAFYLAKFTNKIYIQDSGYQMIIYSESKLQ